ncbi:T9SS type A sorting domain-containing protein [Mangrovimonas cancribranchiae]|uniref:T9SS type A sorting domain-containing protein n=1 Tax=Mangrovimonas cancribranchiae TaxID=3080055 RepID=A0AAU6P4G4_9FLAO
MKKITFYLFALFALAFSWQGMAQSTCTQTFSASGTDDGPTVLTINAADLTCNNSQTIQSLQLVDAADSLTADCSTDASDWYGFDLSIDGGAAIPVCAAEINNTDITGFTSLTITSHDDDAWSDDVTITIDVEVTYETPTCTPVVVDSSTVADDCGNSEFSVDVVVSTVGDGTFVSDGTNTFPIIAGTVTAGPYTIGDTVTLTVQHSDSACDFPLGDFETGCALPGEVCENSIVVGSLPYSTTDDTSNYGDDYGSADDACSSSSYLNGDDVVYSFTPATDMSVNMTTSGTGTWVGLFVYEQCPFVTCVDSDTQSGGNPSLPEVSLVAGTTYYIVISTYPSPQSTAYTLDITENTCTAVTADFNVVSDCDTSGGFYVEVDVTDMGSATDLTVSDDQGSPSQPLSAVGTLQFGPYVNGTDVVITIDDDNDDGSCTVTSSAVTQTDCPPANDDFANAEAVTCGGTYTGSTQLATLDEDDAPDGFGADLDGPNVWYSYDSSVEGAADVTVSLCGSGYDTAVLIYTGTSGNLTVVAGNDDFCSLQSEATFTADGTQTYYITINGYSSTSTGSYTMDVTCEASCTPAQANQDCASAIAMAVDGNTNTVDNTCASVNAEQTSCDTFGTIADIWYTFEVPASQEVEITTTLGTATAAHVAVYSGTCGALVGETCSDGTAEASVSLSGLTAGETYYLQLWNNGSEEGTFDVVLSDPTMSVDNFSSDALFTYYPNPVNNMLSLKAQSNISNVSVYNMLGQEVIRTAPNTVSNDVNMSELQAGAYFVKVTVNGATETIRIIKK